MNHVSSLSNRPILAAVLVALAASVAPACKSTNSAAEPAPPAAGRVDLSNELTANATVTALEPEQRLITLRRVDGSMFTVEAGPAVRNYDQIAVGDTLRVRYHEALAATKQGEGATTSPAEAAFAAGRAKPGANPGGGVGFAARARVRIESIDREHDIVVYSLDSGELRSIRAVRPEGRSFIANLKVGDIVQFDYTKSLALAIEKL